MELRFEVLGAELAEALLPIWSDWKVVRFTYLRGVGDLESCRARLEKLPEYREINACVGPFAVFLENGLAGSCGGFLRDPALGDYGVNYYVDRRLWRRGIGGAMAAELFRRVFALDGARRISVEVVAENTASWKILERLGMARERHAMGKFANAEGEYELYRYGLAAEAWRARSASGAPT